MSMYKSKIKVGNKEKVLVCINHTDDTTQVTETTSVSSLHHIHILDRSGSMYSSINSLIDNVQKTIEAISDDDLLTVIWFASAGQQRTVIKGAKKFDKLNTILDGIRSTLGCTCFSDPLKEVNTILDELGDIAPVSVTLFTDGQPVTPWSSQEEENRCMVELGKMKDRILSFNTVGYGNYYNQELLKKFSATSEYGTMVHSTNIDDYLTIFNHNFSKVSDAVCESLYVASEGDIVYLNRNFSKMTNKTFDLKRIDRRKNQLFLIHDNDFPFIYQDQPCGTIDTKFISKVPEASLTNFLYAYAYNLYYEGRRLESLDVLAFNLRDKALIDSHLSSFTFDEVAVHTEKLRKAVFDNSARYLDCKCDEGYLPAFNAPCVMDVMYMLQKTDSYYVPFSKNIESYKRTTRKAEDSFNLFTYSEKEVLAPFSDFVFNKSKMNLSVRFYINGSVKLNPKEAKVVDLPSTIESGMFRQHTVILDGNLALKTIECIVPTDVFDEDYMTFIQNITFDDGAFTHIRCLIDLSHFPVVNRSYIDSVTDIIQIFNDTVKATQLEARQKIVNYYIDQIASDVLKKTGFLKDYTVDQIRLLESHGLDKNLNYKGVEISKAKAEDSDMYEVKSMEFYLSGFSTWVKVSEMFDRVKSGKKMTPNIQELCNQNGYIVGLAEALDVDLNKECVATRDFLFMKRDEIKSDLLDIRNNLSILKIAKLLSGDWFPELKTNDKGEYYYEKDGYTMIAKVARIKEYC